MNKFAKALLLTLVVAAPVAISVPAVQAKPVASTRMHHAKRHSAMHRNARPTAGAKAVSVKK